MRTLSTTTCIELEIKRSRFIAQASRVDSLADTKAFYEAVADPAATHNCWAWKLEDQYRFNDDGEPASTAGRPILAAIEGKGLSHCMIVVTRYFGGIKLGAGGLVRAYGGAASRCIDHAVLMEVQPELECVVEADFAWIGQVYAALEACQATRLGESYAAGGVRIRTLVRESDLDKLRRVLRDATRGEAQLRLEV